MLWVEVDYVASFVGKGLFGGFSPPTCRLVAVARTDALGCHTLHSPHMLREKGLEQSDLIGPCFENLRLFIDVISGPSVSWSL